jgi:putative ABC transport system permease protein
MLKAYSRRFREQFADGMQYAFEAQLLDARQKGPWTVALFWLRSLAHTLWFGLGERLSGLGRNRRRMPRRQHTRRPHRLGSVGRELCHAARRLLRSPGLTVTAVLSLTLGIGANAAIFSVVHGVLIEPLPYPDSDRLVGVWHDDGDDGKWGHARISYLFYRDNNRAFQEMGIFRASSASLTGGDTPEEVWATVVSASMFDVLEVPPELGRGFVEDDERPGAERTVVLSHQLWTRRFGRDEAIIGETIRVDGSAHTVIGVMPQGFQFPTASAQIWLPMEIDRANPDRSYWNSIAIARLAPGVDVATAQADMQTLAGRLYEAYPDPESAKAGFEELHLSTLVHPFKDDIVGDVSGALLILLGSVGCVLLIACANVANLFLAHAEGRQHEVAVRTALGADRAAIALYFTTESTILALTGGALGLALAQATTPAILALAPQQIPRMEGVGLDGPVLLFTLAVSILSSLLFGLMPMLKPVPNPATAMQSGGYRMAGGPAHRQARNALAVVQLTLALMLMAGSGLMVRSFQKIRSIELGFDAAGVLTMDLHLSGAGDTDHAETVAFYQQVLEHARALPGVQAAGATSGLPLNDDGAMLGHTFEDFPLGPDEFVPNYSTQFLMPGYLETLRIPLLSGRTFDRRDLDGTSRAVMVSAPLAERLWPDQNPIGKRLTPNRFDVTGVWYEIVGVAGPVRYESLDAPATEVVYYPLMPLSFAAQAEPIFFTTLSLAVRTNVPPSSLIGPVSAAVRSIEPNVPFTSIRTMEEIVTRASARTAFSMLLLVIAAGVALALGIVGLYGVISYMVSKRTREIGIRMALGADRGSVSRMVLRQGLGVAAVGIALGLAGAVAVTRLLGSMLYEVSATDPLTLVVVSVVLLAVAMVASYLPARRAARVDPMEAVGEL